MKDGELISTLDLLVAATDILVRNGFSRATPHILPEIDFSRQAIFEDPYSIVAIIVFDTWHELVSKWANAQTSFVDLVSRNISKDEMKSWDCYLLLWTADYTPFSSSGEREVIRYDTSRVRKLVASGEELKEIADVEAALLPLLPIVDTINASTQMGVLDRIPSLLESRELSASKIQRVIDAFEKQESLAEAIHNFGGER